MSYPYNYNLAGRPRRADLDRYRKENERAEYEHMIHQQNTNHRLEEALAQIKTKSGESLPPEIGHMLQVLMSVQGSQPFNPPYPNLSLDQAADDFVRNTAMTHPGVYIHRTGGRVEIYDFAKLIAEANRIVYHPLGDERDRDPVAPTVEVYIPTHTTIKGEPALAFLAFLHYAGLFLVDEAKRPCPDCTTGPPRDCETCGGLRWIIPEKPANYEKIAARIDCTCDSDPLGRCVVHPALSDPQFSGLAKCRCGFEGKIESAEFFEHVRDCKALENADPQRGTTVDSDKIIGMLLDKNLRGLSVLQAIERWCNSDFADTPMAEALEAIRNLAHEALEQK